MNFKLLIFNLIIIIFICCLIYIYLYINYTFEGFEIEEDTLESNALSQQETIENIKPTQDEVVRDGSLNNAIDSKILPYFNYSRIAKGQPELIDNYYWVTLPNIGDRWIYCIMDTSYFGGGWLLAMRGVRGSKTFNYYSNYWTNSTSTLNSDFTNISLAIEPDNDKVDLNVSSIGNKIFNDYTGNQDKINKLDAKYDTFNNYPASEWMAIFYFKNDNDVIYKGGDELTNLTSQELKKGWVWYERFVSLEKGVNIPPVQLFSYLTTTFSNISSSINLTDKYTNERADKIDKFYKKPNNYPQLWSSQKSYNFYGVNYEVPTKRRRNENVRWGFTWNDENNNQNNDVYSGIGTNYKGFSAGDFTNDCNRCFDTAGVNTSIAFEWYVR